MPRIPQYKRQKQYPRTQGGGTLQPVRQGESVTASVLQQGAQTLHEIDNAMYEEKAKSNALDAERKLSEAQEELNAWATATDEQIGTLTEEGVQLSDNAQSKFEQFEQIAEQYDVGQEQIRQEVNRAKVEATASLKGQVRKREASKMAVNTIDNYEYHVKKGNAEKAIESLDAGRNAISGQEYQERKNQAYELAQFHSANNRLQKKPDLDLQELKKRDEYSEVSNEGWGILQENKDKLLENRQKQRNEMIDEIEDETKNIFRNNGYKSAKQFVKNQELEKDEEEALLQDVERFNLDRPLFSDEQQQANGLIRQLEAREWIKPSHYKEVQKRLSKYPYENEYVKEVRRLAKDKHGNWESKQEEAVTDVATPFIEELKSSKDKLMSIQLENANNYDRYKELRGMAENLEDIYGMDVSGVPFHSGLDKSKVSIESFNRIEREIKNIVKNNPEITSSELNDKFQELIAPTQKEMLKYSLEQRLTIRRQARIRDISREKATEVLYSDEEKQSREQGPFPTDRPKVLIAP